MSSKQIGLQNSIKKTQYDIEKLEKAMSDMQNAEVPTQEYQEIQQQIEAAQKKLSGYLETEQRMKDTGADLGGQGWKNLQWKIEDARNTIKYAKAELQGLEESGNAVTIGGDTTKLSDMQNKLELLKGRLTQYQAKLRETEGQEEKSTDSSTRLSRILGRLSLSALKAWTGMKKLGTTAKTIASGFGKVASGVGKAIVGIGKLTGKMFSGQKGAKGYNTGLKEVLKSMILYQGLSKIMGALTETLWGALRTNSQFVSSLAQVKGNLFTAFQPIFTAIMPAINIMMQGIVKLTGYLAQFTSMLFGQSVKSSQAAAKAQYNQAKALDDTGKSAKDAKKQLSALDELNNTTENDSSSGGGNEDGIAPDFDTNIDTSQGVSDFASKLKEAWNTADFTEIGEIVASKINGALEAINWDSVQGVSQKAAKSIYTFINGAVDGLDWKLVGSTIGNGLNTAVQFADTLITGIKWDKLGSGIGTGLQSAIKTIDWAGIGKLLSDGVNSISSFINNFYKSVDWVGFGSNIASSLNTAVTNTDWSAAGQAVGNALNIIIETAYGFITTFDWKKFGQGIADEINAILTTTDWVKLAKGASKLVTGLLDTLTEAIKGIDWELVGTTIGDMLSEIDWGGIAGGLIDLLVAAFNGLVSTVFGIGETIGKNIMDGLKDGVTLSDIIKNAATWVNEHIFKPIVDNIKSLFGIHSPSTVMKEIGTFIMQGMINGITSLVSSVNEKFKTLVSDVKSFFTGLPGWFEGKFNDALAKIKAVFSASAMKTHFESVWTNIKSVFSGVATWFKDTFTTAWTNVKNVFSTGGKIFSGLKEGIADTFRTVVNKLIDGINAIIATPFNKINDMISILKKVPVVGPFLSGFSLPVPKIDRIPALANGTVVPANYGSFLSILGDNKKDPEIVSPVPTMEQAVENVLRRLGVGGNGDISLYLTLIKDGKKEFEDMVKINTEQASQGNLSFALNY
jgi:hypothetical protein